jgi:hypothetical protein
MAKEQKGFIVYGDIKATADELTDEQLGQLFRGMIDYFVQGECPRFTDSLKFAFIPIKQQMDRDADKYIEKCEKMRDNANKRWNDMQKHTIASKSNQLDANDANTNTNTNTNTKTNTDTDTTTNTKSRGGASDGDDSFNLWKQLDADGIDAIYSEYPESGGFLIEEVAADVRVKKKRVRNAVSYVLGYAKRVGWDDNADHFDGGDLS